MAKGNSKSKAVKSKPENKAEKVVAENKEKSTGTYKGYIVIAGIQYPMAEAKAKLMVKQGRAKF